MEARLGDPEKRRRVAVACVLLAGLALALFVYLRAPAVDDAGSDWQDSKQYLRQMELYGGKANVLASQLREWFAGLWRGKALGGTMAFLSLLLAGATWLALTPLPPTVDPQGAKPTEKPGA